MKQAMHTILTVLFLALIVHADEQAVAPNGVAVTNAQLVVQPGIGIPGIIARGMSLVEVQQATGDTRTYTSSVHRVCFPSVGAIFDSDEDPNIAAHVLFIVNNMPDYPTLHFSGSLLGGLSFANDPVDRAQVVAKYGEPKKHIQCDLGDTLRQQCLKTEATFSHRYRIDRDSPYNREMLNYQDIGLVFWLTDDLVTGVFVHPPRAGDTPTTATNEAQGDAKSP